jgi:hypothetical protein
MVDFFKGQTKTATPSIQVTIGLDVSHEQIDELTPLNHEPELVIPGADDSQTTKKKDIKS